MSSLRIEPYDARQRPPSPGLEITRRLLRHLNEGHLVVGQRLPGERQLAEELGVGRATIREALKSLTLLGLLEVRQGDGTYLSATTSETLPQVVEWSLLLGGRSVRSLTEARLHLEVLLAGLAASRRTDAGLASMDSAYRRMGDAAEAGDEARYAEADADFHLAVAAASENEILAGVLSSIGALLRSWTARVTSHGVALQDSLVLHRPILEAIRAQDAARASRAMEAHMEQAIFHLRETLEATEPEG